MSYMRTSLFRIIVAVTVLLGSAATEIAAQASSCVGDCDESGDVSVAELGIAVQLALTGDTTETCLGADANGDDSIAIEELVTAVHHAASGCPGPATVTPTPTLLPTPTATVRTLPVVTTSTTRIEPTGTTTLTLSINPNGFALSAAIVVLQVVPAEIHLVAVTGLNGFSASGPVGSDLFSFGIAFGVDQTAPLTIGTIQVEGRVPGGELRIFRQDYTDSQFNDLRIETQSVLATVATGSS